MNPDSWRRRILVVDDEPELRQTIRSILESAGYSVREAANGYTALGQITVERPDAVLLDLGLPDLHGCNVLRALRPMCAAPVVVISVSSDEANKVSALDAGADDYLTKPFGRSELLARLRALERRMSPPVVQPLKFGPLVVDLDHRRVLLDDQRIKLTRTEYSLLRLLVTNADRVLTHRQILHDVWGPHAIDQIHYLRLYMTRLRQKLGEDLADACFETESGVGYRFIADPQLKPRPTVSPSRA